MKLTGTSKRVVLLAHSYKHGGFCVAGKEIVDGRPAAWVRPVSDRDFEEVSAAESTMSNGRPAELLDVVTMNLKMPVPRHHQQENWLLSADDWKWQMSIGWERLARLVDAEGDLWLEEGRANDRVSSATANTLLDSLRLISVDRVNFARRTWDGRAKWRAIFDHHDARYDLSLTDTASLAELNRIDRVQVELGPSFLSISLGEVFNGFCYKLVAGVFNQELKGMQ